MRLDHSVPLQPTYLVIILAVSAETDGEHAVVKLLAAGSVVEDTALVELVVRLVQTGGRIQLRDLTWRCCMRVTHRREEVVCPMAGVALV